MLTRLSAYYKSKGISAVDFRCPHRAECGAVSARFTTAKESHVGPQYEAGNAPRLLFLSLDSGSAATDAASKTMQAVRAQTLACDVDALPKHKHWYLTHEMAWVLLRQFHPHLTVAQTHRYFAHVNSAKCCQNNQGKSKASGVLFRNCRQFIPGELRILEPDILVTQGGEARDVIVKECRLLKHERRDIHEAAYETGLIMLVSGRETLWLQTYHPNNYGRFWKQREHCWPRYVEAVTRFMAQRGAPA